jgi:lipopolysaccharide transport system ATP-binding protein
MAAVRSLCRRAVWLDHGQVREDGAVEPITNAFLQSMLANSTTGQELTKLARPEGMGKQLRVERYEFNGGSPLRHGEALRCRVEFCAYADLEDVAIGFGFNALDGSRILSFDSDITSARHSLRAGQRAAVEFTLPRLDLEPGTYVLNVGARSGIRNMLDGVMDGLWAEVLPGPSTPDFIIGQRAGVRAAGPCVWDMGLARRASEMAGQPA